jgi:hypothetical protein
MMCFPGRLQADRSIPFLLLPVFPIDPTRYPTTLNATSRVSVLPEGLSVTLISSR